MSKRRRPPPTKRSGARPGRGARKGARKGRAQGRVGDRPTTRQGVGGEQVEGRQAVLELLVAGRRRVHELFVSVEDDELIELAGQLGVPVRQVGRGRLDAMARTDAPQGVVAHAAPLAETEFDDLLEGDGLPLLLAADGVTDPGNLGALLRSAQGAGVTGVVLPRHRAVHVTPAVTKAAAGAVEHLRFTIVGGLPAALARARDAGVLVLGLDAGGDLDLHGDLPPLDVPVLLVVGAEGRGLGRLVGERCDGIVAIPLAGGLESLNVSVAGALALFEVVRRRRHTP